MGLHIVVVKDIPKVHSILRGWVGGKRASVFSCICVLHWVWCGALPYLYPICQSTVSSYRKVSSWPTLASKAVHI